MGTDCYVYGVSFGGDESVLKLDSDDRITLNILKATELFKKKHS